MNPNVITPAVLSDFCSTIARALAERFPDNVWMVLPDPDPAAYSRGGYGFLVETRCAGDAALAWDFIDSTHILPAGGHPMPRILRARPWVNDMLKGIETIQGVIIPGLIQRFEQASGVGLPTESKEK